MKKCLHPQKEEESYKIFVQSSLKLPHHSKIGYDSRSPNKFYSHYDEDFWDCLSEAHFLFNIEAHPFSIACSNAGGVENEAPSDVVFARLIELGVALGPLMIGRRARHFHVDCHKRPQDRSVVFVLHLMESAPELLRQARLSLLWFALSLIRILVSFLSCISMCMQAASDPWTRSFNVADVSFLCTCMKCNVHMFLKCFYPEAFSQARLKAFVCILCPPRTLRDLEYSG